MRKGSDKKIVDLFTGLPGRPAYYYFGVYALAVIILFHRPLFGLSQLLYGTDLMAGNLFFRHFWVEFFKSNFNWPVWDPYIHGGMPFIEGMHGDIFYIPSLVFYLILGVNYAWGFLFALHAFAAGVFLYLYLKEIGIRGKVAFWGGLTYLTAPLFISLVYAGHNGKFFVIALTPLLFFLFHRAIATDRLVFYLLLSLTMFLVMASPHMQLAYFLFLAFGAYVVVHIIWRWRIGKRFPLKTTCLTGIAVILGVLLSLVQFAAPYEYLNKYSMRTLRAEKGQGYEYSTSWSMHWEELAAGFFPEFCGDNISGKKQTYWGRNPFKLNSEHVSVIALFLAILGLGMWKRPDKWFFAIVALIATTFALGANTPLFRLYYLLPGIRSFRAPSLITFLGGFSIITLGAMGLESVLAGMDKKKPLSRWWRIFTYACLLYTLIIVLLLVLGMGFFRVWFSIFGYTPDGQKLETLSNSLSNIATGAIISLVMIWATYFLLNAWLKQKITSDAAVLVICAANFIYLAIFNSKFIVTVDPKDYYARSPIVDFFEARQTNEPFRVFVLPQTLPDYYLAYHGIEEISLTQLHGNHLAAYEKITAQGGLTRGPIRDLLNAKYLVSRQNLPPSDFKEVANFGGLKVFESLGAMPRAVGIYKYEVVPDEQEILARLRNSTFDYRSTLLLRQAPPVPLLPANVEGGFTPARIINRRNNQFDVEIDLAADGFLFLSENYYPAWKAYESGHLLKTIEADLAFRAIPLTKGKHLITCRFENQLYRLTSRVSGLTLLVVVTGILVDMTMRRKPSKR